VLLFWLHKCLIGWFSTVVTQISVNVDNFSGRNFYNLSNNKVHSHSLDSWFLKPQDSWEQDNGPF